MLQTEKKHFITSVSQKEYGGFSQSHLHFFKFRKVSWGDVMLFFNPVVDLPEVGYKLFLLGFFPEHSGHLLLQSGDDVRMHLQAKGRKTEQT